VAGRGPLAAPGAYQVRVTIGAWTATEPLVVRADPRVTADGVTDAVLAEQQALALRVRDALSEARRTAGQVRDLKPKLAADSSALRTLADAERALVTASGPYPTPMLLDQLTYLYGMVTGADQLPGRDSYTRLEELNRRHAEIVARLRSLPGWSDR
jgi:hypothetical protein